MKKIFLFIMFSILLLSSVNALVFGSKSYDEKEKIIAFSDITGKVADIKLNTPLIYPVMRGKDRLVAEFTIKHYKDYSSSDVFKGMELINNSNGKNINRNINYKFKKSAGFETFNEYKNVCIKEILENKTEILTSCSKEFNKTFTKEVFNWVKLDYDKLFKEGEITIGIFADVLPNDNIEWVQNFYGIKATEWATWTDGYNSGLIEYWNFDLSSGSTIIGSLNRYNMTSNSSTWVTGKNNNGMNFTRTSSQFARTTSNVGQLANDNFTVNGWVKLQSIPESSAGTFKVGQNVNLGGAEACDLWVYLSSAVYIAICPNNLESSSVSSSNDIGSWVMLSMVYYDNLDKYYLFRNGEAIALLNGATSGQGLLAGEFQIVKNSQGNFIGAVMDEIGIWNRSLTTDDLLYLYDSGAGTFYTDVSPVNVYLVSPVNNSLIMNLPTGLAGNVTGSSSVGITNVSLYINGSPNITNTSGYQGIYNFSFSGPIGNYTWNIKAFGNNSLEYSSSNGSMVINITETPTNLTINLLSPNNNTIEKTLPFSLAGLVNKFGLTITNVSLYLNDVINITNTSGYNGIYNFSLSLPNGNYTWTIKAIANNTLEYTSGNGSRIINVSIPDTLPNQTLIIPNFSIGYNDNLNVDFNDYFSNLSVLEIGFVNLSLIDYLPPQIQSLIPTSVGSNNEYFLNTNFNILNNITTLNLNSYENNRTIEITPIACNVNGCLTGNTFSVIISDIPINATTSQLMTLASNWISSILPDENEISFSQKFGIIFIVLLIISIGLILTSKNAYITLFGDAIVILFFTSIGYISVWLLVGIVVIILAMMYLKGKGDES